MELPAENGAADVLASLEQTGSANLLEDGSSVAETSEIASSHDILDEPAPPANFKSAIEAAATTSTTAAAADSTRSSTNDISDERRRLTEDEKKQNHVASENKRREAIREGFDRLAEIVPGLQGRGRSEALVLERTLDFLREQLRQRKSLIERIEERGGTVDPRYRVPDLPPDFLKEGGADIADLEDD
ncbi:putative bHLH domain-containing protein [Escovopsis weberi]|uniref:Putative bHLH domain-containing protein n=1 Tax=Escovopsis weberi TaxID=150374 RepID=A0A0M9VSH0_ESCWE|nr:putative bHLH domain-containing protein [Escovopsis weberi]